MGSTNGDEPRRKRLRKTRGQNKCYKQPKVSKESSTGVSLNEIDGQTDSSELSDIVGDALELNSDVLLRLEVCDHEDIEECSSETVGEDSADFLYPSSPQGMVPLEQSVKNQDIEKTKREGMNRDGKKLLEEADSSLLIDENFQEFLPNLRFQEDSLDSNEQYVERMAIRNFYTIKYSLPPVLSSNDLIENIQTLLPIVQDMYKGVVDSYYKFEASLAVEQSNDGILSVNEFRALNINKFVAGFYGIRRQLRVGEEILRKFKSFLLKRQGHTMRWWGVNDFANYVLAPEVLASLCIKEMNLGPDLYDRETRENAYEIFDKTIEFGLKVADADPLETWETQIEDGAFRDLEPNNLTHTLTGSNSTMN